MPKTKRIPLVVEIILWWQVAGVTSKKIMDLNCKIFQSTIKEFIYHLCHWLQQSRTVKEKERVTIQQVKPLTPLLVDLKRNKMAETKHQQILTLGRWDLLINHKDKIHNSTSQATKGHQEETIHNLDRTKDLLHTIRIDSSLGKLKQELLRWMVRIPKRWKCYIRNLWILIVLQVKLLRLDNLKMLKICNLIETTCKVLLSLLPELEALIQRMLLKEQLLEMHTIKAKETIQMLHMLEELIISHTLHQLRKPFQVTLINQLLLLLKQPTNLLTSKSFY